MTLAVTRFPRLNSQDAKSRRERVLEILGSIVLLAYEDLTGTFLITSSDSPELPAPYAENWLSEPLRIIFGQLIYPRLVARNFGGGRAQVQIRRSPALIRGARWAALWERVDAAEDTSVLWLHYVQLLALIARARDEDGRPNFEPHKITRLYEEIIQAALGSRWVWALTYASSIEALTKMLMAKDAKLKSPQAEAAIEVLVKHIDTGPGDPHLKAIAVNAVRRTVANSTIKSLRNLKAAGVITEVQLFTWEKIRHAVMHGSLVSPYSSAEDDARLLSLAAMMHALTRELVRRSVAASAA